MDVFCFHLCKVCLKTWRMMLIYSSRRTAALWAQTWQIRKHIRQDGITLLITNPIIRMKPTLCLSVSHTSYDTSLPVHCCGLTNRSKYWVQYVELIDRWTVDRIHLTECIGVMPFFISSVSFKWMFLAHKNKFAYQYLLGPVVCWLGLFIVLAWTCCQI